MPRDDTRASNTRVFRRTGVMGPLVFAVTTFFLTACASPRPPSALIAELVTSAASASASVQEGSTAIRLTGLSSAELSDLREAVWAPDQWQAFLGVKVDAGADLFVSGRYLVRTDSVEFAPAFPFDPGRSYAVRIDPSRLPTPRLTGVVEASLSLPGVDPGAPTMVTAIHPAGDTWPANLLRFYVHFSGPMPRQPGVAFVRLLDDRGKEGRDALLQSPVDFWSPDQRRYTVFFDPGRVKSDLVPNLELGRVLIPGRRYAIVIDRGWKDVAGRELASEVRKTILVGPAVDRPLALKDWKISAPRAGTREPLVVTVPWPLDHALFARTVGVSSGGEPVDGIGEVRPGDTEWRFVPSTAWQSVPHELVVLSVLEDPSGNGIDRAFEVDSNNVSDKPRPERYSVGFGVR